MVTTAGKPRPCERWGRVTFARDGETLTLQVYRLLDLPDRPGGEGLFLPFKDRTSGKETYTAGRYVDSTGPTAGRSFWISIRPTTPRARTATPSGSSVRRLRPRTCSDRGEGRRARSRARVDETVR
jgi:hypothetical protein